MEDLQESLLNLSVVSRNDIDDNEEMEDLQESLLNLSVEMISMIMRKWKIYRNLF